MLHHDNIFIDVQRSVSADVDIYIMNRFKYRKEPGHLRPSKFFATIDVYRKFIRLYIRLMHRESTRWPKDTIVIAVLEFFNTRVGHGTDFLNFILSTVNKYGYKYIGIENSNDESAAFAQKFGFHESETSELCGTKGMPDYLISVDKLNLVLDQKHSVNC